MKLRSSVTPPVRPTRSRTMNTASASVLEFPHDNVEPARNSRPVVLLHGTLVEKEGIAAFRDYALRAGHPVNHRTYQSITKGERIEKSAELASRQVNLSRSEVARRNLENLEGKNPEELKAAFSLDASLYGSHDPDVETILTHIPSLLENLGKLVRQPEEDRANGLSGQLKELEKDFSGRLKKDGLPLDKAKAVVRELVDTVAPKAIVVGHSAGAYVAYAMAVNPESTPDQDPFTFDGGNGVGEVVVISGPIRSGLPKPAPTGVADLPFYNWENTMLRPFEQLPPMNLMLGIPGVGLAYNTTKELMRGASRLGFMATAQLTTPLIHFMRPGNAQVEEGSSFFRNYVQDKEIPNETSVIAITSPLDRLAEEERSKLETDQLNGHTFSVDLQVSEKQVQEERPTWAHVIMVDKPDSFKQQFATHLRNNPDALARFLDQANDDGVQHEALSMARLKIESDPDYLKRQPELMSAMQKLAEEKLPFSDSPSYLAHQLITK